MPPKRNSRSKKVDTSESRARNVEALNVKNADVEEEETKTESPKRKGGSKSKGGGGKRYEIVQKGLVKGEDVTVATFDSQAACQREVEKRVAESNRSLKLHDFEIVPSK